MESTIETSGININEFREIISESLEDVLIKGKDLIGDAVLEALEDIGLARAMEEGRTGEYVDAQDFIIKLNAKVKKN